MGPTRTGDKIPVHCNKAHTRRAGLLRCNTSLRAEQLDLYQSSHERREKACTHLRSMHNEDLPASTRTTDLPILVDPKHFGRAAVDPLALLVLRESIHEPSVDVDVRLILEHHCGSRGPLGVVLPNALASNRPQLDLLPWPQLQNDNGPAMGETPPGMDAQKRRLVLTLMVDCTERGPSAAPPPLGW